jgi:Pyridine nucleotide-disulphide oxidoreductase
MEIETDLLIIGAGPFGLAMAAQATHSGLNHQIVGIPMEFWRANMPSGMYLRSACDWHLDPAGEDTIENFVKTRGLTTAQVKPRARAFYLRYAQWFQEQKGIEPLPTHIRRLDRSARAGRFHATTEDGQIITAHRVVVAVGFKYFKHLPAEIVRRAPPGRVWHTCDLVNFAALRGKRCLILGGRQSAFECVERPDGALGATLDNDETLIVDQLIAATGYMVDIARVPFLAAGNLLEKLTIRNGFPTLDAHFQTNISGLFITSMPAVQDFGPFWAFTIAAPASAQVIGQALLARIERAA